ncbi:MAG: aldo/keto reductase [Desulfopila sp.]
MKQYSHKNTTIPALGLGTWKSGKGEVYGAVRQALDIGYRHIDCAPAYNNEEEVGAALKERFAAKNVRREDVWITSKLWNNAHIPEDVAPALKKSLKDLQLEYLDLYLIHWPVAFRPQVFFPKGPEDYLKPGEVPIIETWQAMEECVEQGLIRQIGVCNFSSKKLGDLLDRATIAPMMNQIELHPYLQQEDMLRFCRDKDVLLTAYSPLGSVDRPKGMKKQDEPSLLENPVIVEIGARHNISSAQVLIGWALQRDTVVIPKSVNQERLQQNVAAADVVLDDEGMQAIKNLDMHYRYVDGGFFAAPGSGYTVAGIWDE